MNSNLNERPHEAAATPGLLLAPCSRRALLGAAAGAGTALCAGRLLPGAWTRTALAATQGAPTWPCSNVKELLPAEAPALRDDFYTAVNYDWLRTNTIPGGRGAWNAFGEYAEVVSEELDEILRNPSPDSPDEVKAALFFSQSMDQEARDAAGLGTYLAADFQDILAVSTLDDVTALLTTNERVARVTGLVPLSVRSGLQDSAVNACYISSSSVTLDDPAAYADPTDYDVLVCSAYEEYTATLLAHFGVPDDEARQMSADRTAFEAALASGMYDAETASRPDFLTLVNNPRTREELAEAAAAFPLVGLLDIRGYTADGAFILEDPGWLSVLAELYTEENTGLLRAYLATGLVRSVSQECGSASLAAYSACSAAIYGTGDITWDSLAHTVLDYHIGDLLGRIYVTHYFPESAKREAEGIAAELMAAFEQRLAAADWLSEATRATAIEKFRSMDIGLGYPDSYRPWEKIEFIGESFIDNVAIVDQAVAASEAARFGRPADDGLWPDGVYAHAVDSFSNYMTNAVMLPAGILQGTFYDPDASRAAKLGGIGTFLASGMARAVDSAGSQFDKDGNFVDWWTSEDRAAFDERAAPIADYYSDIVVFDDVHVQGDLTLDENINEMAGMAVALDVLGQEDNPDYEEFFGVFAQNWRILLTKEYQQYLIEYSTQAPEYLRTNVVVQQFQQFHDTYGVVEGDGMYLPAEQRLGVW